MNSLPISVLIITFKRDVLLKRCLDSLFLQNSLPNEVIIIDNGQSSLTKRLVYGYSNKGVSIHFITNKENNVPQARNMALHLAKNNFCVFLDDDCIASRDWVKVGYIALSINPSVVYCGKSSNINCNQNILGEYEYRQTENFFSKYRKRIGKRIISYFIDTKNCALDKRILLRSEVKFDERFRKLEDIDISYSLASKQIEIRFINQMRVKHHYRTSFFSIIPNYFQIGYYHAVLNSKWGILFNQFSYPYSDAKYLITSKKQISIILCLYRFFVKIPSYLGMFVYKMTPLKQ